MRRKVGVRTSVMTMLLALSIAVPLVFAADISQEQTAKYILATVKAFRTVYVKGIIEQAKKAGIKPNENWAKDDHAIMLNAQFVKAAGAELKDFELGLIGLTPTYKFNLPKTQAEADALKQMMASPYFKVLTFADGNQYKRLTPDHAILHACVASHDSY